MNRRGEREGKEVGKGEDKVIWKGERKDGNKMKGIKKLRRRERVGEKEGEWERLSQQTSI